MDVPDLSTGWYFLETSGTVLFTSFRRQTYSSLEEEEYVHWNWKLSHPTLGFLHSAFLKDKVEPVGHKNGIAFTIEGCVQLRSGEDAKLLQCSYN